MVESSSSIAEREDHIDSNSERATPTPIFTTQPEREWNLELIPEGEDTKMEIQEHNEKDAQAKGNQDKKQIGKMWKRTSAKVGRLARQENQLTIIKEALKVAFFYVGI
ncbi:RNA-binding (RRM/RBD/RNP motifs) family protein [Striga asiatica]|uniref:RNA-binding (RRM/RBD/RNP motifs) family protein n=1 Tax=Striga asiatica TaxID=4170 RepID=A0A5A7PU04_STRAF|nr:RNA-binding (RRM/RBD/RNP motifs) family protein [Striga asiatica]